MEENNNKICFEENLKELEMVVKKLESGDASLDEMLELFERGIKLTKSCTELLDGAEQKINVLIKDADGGFNVRPFDAN